jgi:hypothetical protein
MKPLRPGGLPRLSASTPAWLWAVPLFSCGFLGFIPPLVIATKVKTRPAWLWAAGFAVADVLGLAAVGSQPDNVETFWTNFGVLVIVAAGIGAVFYGAIVGPKLDWSPKMPVVTVPSYDPNPVAIAGVMAARQKRVEARAVAQRDPLMARDLRIGRPDLPRNYDDGGLVDVNSAPTETIAKWLGLSQAQAAQVVEVRHQLGKFERVDDLLNLVGLELTVYDQVSDRIILL